MGTYRIVGTQRGDHIISMQAEVLLFSLGTLHLKGVKKLNISCAQGSLLTLGLGITPVRSWGTIWGAKD